MLKYNVGSSKIASDKITTSSLQFQLKQDHLTSKRAERLNRFKKKIFRNKFTRTSKFGQDNGQIRFGSAGLIRFNETENEILTQKIKLRINFESLTTLLNIKLKQTNVLICFKIYIVESCYLYKNFIKSPKNW